MRYAAIVLTVLLWSSAALAQTPMRANDQAALEAGVRGALVPPPSSVWEEAERVVNGVPQPVPPSRYRQPQTSQGSTGWQKFRAVAAGLGNALTGAANGYRASTPAGAGIATHTVINTTTGQITTYTTTGNVTHVTTTPVPVKPTPYLGSFSLTPEAQQHDAHIMAPFVVPQQQYQPPK